MDSYSQLMLILVICNYLPVAFFSLPQQDFGKICNLLVMLPSILEKYFTRIDGTNLSIGIFLSGLGHRKHKSLQ